jgi:hypothetical protein
MSRSLVKQDPYQTVNPMMNFLFILLAMSLVAAPGPSIIQRKKSQDVFLQTQND